MNLEPNPSARHPTLLGHSLLKALQQGSTFNNSDVTASEPA